MGTRTLLQFTWICKSFKILFTTTGFLDCSEQHFIATSANWLDMASANSSSFIFLSLFFQIYLNHLLHCSLYLIDLALFASGSTKLIFFSNTSLMHYKYQYSQHFCWVSFEKVGHSYFRHQRTDQCQIKKKIKNWEISHISSIICLS